MNPTSQELPKTFTAGHKPVMFGNETVHHFYSNLEALLNSMDPSGKLTTLFAQPRNFGVDFKEATEMEWRTPLSGTITPFSTLPPRDQAIVRDTLKNQVQTITTHLEKLRGGNPTERQYADYLDRVVPSTDFANIMVVEPHHPVLVHWGFIPENCDEPQGIKQGWNLFNEKINQMEINIPIPEPGPISSPASPPPPPLAPAEEFEDKLIPGDYSWVRWLALILLIIIILLLLRGCYPTPTPNPQIPPPTSSGGLTKAPPGGTGASPAGLGGKGGGSEGGTGTNGSSGGANSGGGTGSTTGGSGTPSTTGAGGTPSTPGATGNSTGGGATPPPNSGSGGQSTPIKPADSGSKPPPPRPADPKPVKKPAPPIKKTPQGIFIQVEDNYRQVLLSEPPDPKTRWLLGSSDGTKFNSSDFFFEEKEGATEVIGEKITVNILPWDKNPHKLKVTAISSTGERTTYNFHLEPREER